EIPGGQFLVSKFLITGDNNTQATVNVSASAGEGGGLAGNVNRWRGQLGLEQLPPAEVEKLARPIDTAGGKAMLVDMSGADARTGHQARLVGAILSRPNQTWFYKMM